MSNSDNPRSGAIFQHQETEWFKRHYRQEFELEKKLPIGSPPKDHKFDIVDKRRWNQNLRRNKSYCIAIFCVLAFLSIPPAFLHAANDSSAQSNIPENEVNVGIDAAQWKSEHPHEYSTWADSAKNLGENVGKPATMTYAINTNRTISAGCVSCHSTAFVNMYAVYGGDVVSLTESELIAESTSCEGITCYSCHGDQPGELYVSKGYIVEAAEVGGIDAKDPNLVCAQCHALANRSWEEELYSFKEDLAVGVMGDPNTHNWSTLEAGTDANDVYAWFLAHGEKNPKVIPGEMEYQQYRGSSMDKAGVTCSTCHMEKVKVNGVTQYTRHAWQGGQINPTIYENCVSCHHVTPQDMRSHIGEIQSAYQLKLSDVTRAVNAAAVAIKSSDADQDIIAQATELWYEARFHSCYGQDSSGGIHGIGNANTEYCFAKCFEICSTIMEMV